MSTRHNAPGNLTAAIVFFLLAIFLAYLLS